MSNDTGFIGPLLPEVANVHEKTVKDAQKHADAAKKPKKRASRRTRATNTKHITVDPRVMEAALGIVGEDKKRIKIVSDTEVLILNPGVKA